MTGLDSVNLYTTIGELYDYVLDYRRRTGEDLQVVDALRLMRANRLLSAGEPTVPAFHYGEGREQFLDYLRSMPVDALGLIENSQGNFPKREDDIFPAGKDVFAFLHMPYSGRRLHYHNYFEITYLLKGDCCFSFEEESVRLHEGDICLASNWHEVAPPPGCTAVAVVVRKTTFDNLFSGLLSRQDLVSLFFRKCLRDQGHPNYVLLHTGNDPALFYTLRELVQEVYRTDEYANECSADLLSLFLARAIRASAASVTLRHYEGYNRQDFDFSMILHYIQQNYRTVTLANLADAFHFSESYLSRLIQKNLGQSFTGVLRDLKLNRAAELLRTNMKISEISDAVGYVSVDHFTRTFRKVYGLSPRDWRAQQRPDNDKII